MTAQTFPACPHDRETWKSESVGAAWHCDECRARPCMDCRRYGETDFMVPLVSWMTGVCDACYRERTGRDRVRKDYDDASRHRRQLQEAWTAGFEAGSTWQPSTPNGTPSDPPANPHDEPTYVETSLLEAHDWLREEVTW